MSAKLCPVLPLISSSVQLLLLVVGWVLHWRSYRSSSGHRLVCSFQFGSHHKQRVGSFRFNHQHHLSSSGSIPGEFPVDKFDTRETLSGLLIDLLATNMINASATTERDGLRHEQRQREILTARLSHVHSSDPDSKHINICRTYVGNSTIGDAGLGLFARRDFPKGTLLTCYPGDALVELAENSNGISNVSRRARVTWGSHVMKVTGTTRQYKDDSTCASEGNLVSMDDLEYPLQHEYMLRAIYDHWGIIAIPEIFGNDDPTYLGHFANDGAQHPPTCESELAAYMIESTDKANAIHQPLEDCHMITTATRDLKAGDEIFVTYGPDYWREQASFVPSIQYDDDEDYDGDYLEDLDDFDFETDFFSDDNEESNETEIFLSEEPSDSQGKGFG